MSSEKNKAVIRKINDGFQTGNEEQILSCLCDDVHWEVPGAFIADGIEEFRQNITNENFTGLPRITTINEIGEGDYVSVEGKVEGHYANGKPFKAVFHNTYLLKDFKVKRMTSYVVPINN